jgi:uncharacterized protein (TIGR03437 family)
VKTRKLLWMTLALVVRAGAQVSPCDLDGNGSVNVVDAQIAANQANGSSPCTNGDLNHSGVCDSPDVNRVTNAALGKGCIVGPGPEVTITSPNALPAGTVGQSYGPVSFTAASGAGGYTWSATGLPNGLNLSASGMLSGTPAPGSQGSTPQFTVKDSSGATATFGRPLTINFAPLSITAPASLSSGTVGVSYGPVTFAASGGTGGYTWSATGLPNGLSFSAGGVLSGTPAAGSQGSYNPQFTVKDSSNTSANKTLPLTINPPLGISNPTSLPSGTQGVSYGPVTFTASGGTGGYTWSATGLPNGLSFSAGGVLNGTPATCGSYSVQFTVRDSSNATASVTLTWTINCTLTVTTNPSGLQIIVDSNTLVAPQTFQWTPSSSHTIGVTSPQGGAGTQYVFSNWSDGGGQTHSVTASSSATTYTASFATQYLLTTAASPISGGTVTAAPSSTNGYYTAGTSVQLTASPSSGYQFSNWSGDLSGSTNPQSVTMSAPRNVTANFSTVTATSVTVTTNPPGLQISVDGSTLTAPQNFSWSAGSSHTIGVTSPQGSGGTQYIFSNWSDGGGQTHSVTAPSSATTYTASFTTQYLLTTVAAPNSGGTVTAAPSSTNGYYTAGTSVQLTATPSNGYQFATWSGDLSGGTNPQSVTMSAARNVTANFSSLTGVTVTTNPSGLSILVDGLMLTAPQSFQWTAGSSHTLGVSSPQGGAGTQYVFSTWSDGGGQTHNVTAPSSATTYTTSFTTQYLLAALASPSSGGTVAAAPSSTSGYYTAGTSVQLTATSSSGYQFSNWSGDLSGSTNPQSLTMSAPRNVTANFSNVAATPVTVTTNPPGLQITVDGSTVTAPQSFQWTASSSHTIAVTSPQGGGSTQYVFSNWSDGGGQTHSVTAPSFATTYTATFTTQYLLTTVASPSSGGTVTAAPNSTNGYYTAGTSVQLTATPSSGYQFSNWSGDLSGSTNPQSVIVSAPQNVTANFSSLTGVTVTTNPPGLQITVDGSTVTAPQSYQWTAASSHTIGAVSPQGSGGTRSVFTTWSDGGAQTHTVAAPSTATTYTASFKMQYLLTTTVSPANAGSVAASPGSLDGYYDAGTSLQITAVPAGNYQFQNWSGDLAGSTNPQSVVMNAPRLVTANFLSSGGGVTITTASVPNGFVGVVYQTTTLQAQGGMAPYGWNATGLPAGLSVSTGGVLSGTPTVSGPFQITVTVNDSSTPNVLTATRTYSGTVSVPATLLTVSPPGLGFSYVQGDPNQPASQSTGVFSSPTGTSVTASAATTDGGSWLSLSTSFSQGNRTPATILVSVNPARLTANIYSGQVTIVAPNATPSSATVNVILTVIGSAPPQLSIAPTTQSFAVVQGGQPVQGQVAVSNSGGGSLQFSAQASSDANWLTLTGSGSGVATPSSGASLGFTINPGAGLSAGLHRGQITIRDTNSGTQQTAAVALLVNGAQQTMQLSQAGFTFTAVANTVALPPQSFSVFNLGQGSMVWTAQVQTIPPGLSWLHVIPTSGTSAPGLPGQVTISVDQTGLLAGQYYATVKVLAPNAANVSQSVSVLLNVVQPGQFGSAPQVSTGGLILAGVAGSAASVQQDLALFNPAGTALSYSASAFTEDGSNWLTVSSATGSLNPTGTGALTIQANPASVTGVKQGTIQVAFSEGTVHIVGVALVATSGTASAGISQILKSREPNAASGCTPTKLVPKFQAPEQSQRVPAARPQKLQVQVQDDCGTPITGGAVKATFTNSDAGVNLFHEGGGIWAGTWNPVNAQAQVTVQVNAFQALANGSVLAGFENLRGLEVLPANANDAAQPLGALNAASLDKSNAGLVVPGSYVAIYGSRLADTTSQPNGLPLPCNLGSSQLLVGDQCVPLSFASPQQVNGLIPQNLALNTTLQLFVQRGNTGSVPVAVTVTDLQPGIFTTTQNGQGQGAIAVSGTGLIAGPAGPGQRPVNRGEYVEIYCTGLGAVQGTKGEAPPADGVAAPAGGNPLYKTVAPVTVTIGGAPAQVIFAGLAPGFVGLYQVNVQVPDVAPTGDVVPVVLTMAGQNGVVSSPPVTIAVQ